MTLANNQGKYIEIDGTQYYVLQLKTTMMIKLLSRLFPTQSFNANWLHRKVRNNEGGIYTANFGSLKYVGQPGGVNTEHEWEIIVNIKWANKLIEYFNYLIKESLSIVQVTNDGTFTWNNLIFLSEAEVKIAQALERKGVLYFANATCRVKNRNGDIVTKKPDFLVYYKGKSRIFEVDGSQFHTNRKDDYERDRIFDKQGLITTRFTASECFTKPDEVVEEFLELFN